MQIVGTRLKWILVNKEKMNRSEYHLKPLSLIRLARWLLSVFLILILTAKPGLGRERPKIGLVLSGGGARGFAHIGIVKMLDSLNIPIDYIAGTSMGGIVGGLYAIGYNGIELEKLTDRTDWIEIFTDKPPRRMLPYFQKKEDGKFQLEFGIQQGKPAISGLIYGQKISLLFSSLTYPFENMESFDSLPTPFRCIAVDLITGNEVILKQGSLARAIRATMAIPSIFSPVEMGDSLLIDGGILNNLPVDIVRDMGADIIIAVDVMGLDKDQKRPANVIEILEQSIRLLGIERWKKNKAMADIYIQPDLTGFTMFDFENEQIGKIICQGDKAAREHMDELLALKDTCGIDSAKIAESHPSTVLPIYKDNTEKPVIFSIHITGNEKFSFSFIYGLLGLNPGDRLDMDDLNRRIMEVYGLGYFESILYDIKPLKENHIDLQLTVKELPFRKIRVGLRYDSHHKLVGIVGFHGMIYVLSGLRFESELQFAGLSKFNTKIYYPFSRFFQIQDYPYLRLAFKDIPTTIYDRYGTSIAEYPDRSSLIGLGMGFMLDKSTNLEIEYNYEQIDIHPSIAYSESGFFLNWNDELHNLTLRFDLDNLDYALLPKNGIHIYSEMERSLKILQSPVDYFKGEISINLYHTWKKRHTVRYFVFYGYATQSTPIYKHFFVGKPEYFVGMNYDQLAGAHLGIIRYEYQYQIKPSIYVKFITNLIPYGEYRYRGETIFYRRLWGIGLGGVISTPVGPIELIISEGSHGLIVRESKEHHIYFKMGYKF